MTGDSVISAIGAIGASLHDLGLHHPESQRASSLSSLSSATEKAPEQQGQDCQECHMDT